MFEASRGIMKSFVVEIWIAHAEQNNIITKDKDLFKSQKNGIITGRCSKVTLLKFKYLLELSNFQTGAWGLYENVIESIITLFPSYIHNQKLACSNIVQTDDINN